MANDFVDDRDNLDDAGIFEAPSFDSNRFMDDDPVIGAGKQKNVSFNEQSNNDNQVPPEYANDPDLWYTIQASLKVHISLR